MATPVDRGPGSRGPSFTPPSVPVRTPGLGLRPEPTQFEQFRDAVINAAGGVASAVSARSAAKARLRALKEQAVNRVDADLARSARGLQQRRLQRAATQRAAILSEAKDKGPQWAESQFRNNMVNASSREEQAIWEQGWKAASAQVERDESEARQQSFNAAARTMQNAGRALSQELATNPDLKAELIGNGTDIAGRVQDWMVESIGAEVDFDSLHPDDRDALLHQIIQESFGVSDGLIEENGKRIEEANEATGVRQTEADIYSTLTAHQNPRRLGAQLTRTLRDNLNHLTPVQQREYLRDAVAKGLRQAADGSFGLDAVQRVGDITEILNVAVEGERVFTPTEQQQLATELTQRAVRTAAAATTAAYDRIRAESERLVTLPDGSVSRVPGPNPDLALLEADPETGVPRFVAVQNALLAEMGLIGEDGELLEDMTPEQAQVYAAVRSQTIERAAGAALETQKQNTDLLNYVTVMEGGEGGNPRDAYEFDPFRRATLSPQELALAELPGLDNASIEAVRSTMLAEARNMQAAGTLRADDPELLDKIAQWDGSQINDPAMLQVVASVSASQWSNSELQNEYGMPTTVANDWTQKLSSGDPARIQEWATWASRLDVGQGQAWPNYLETLTDNQRAAAVLLRTQWMNTPRGEAVPDGATLARQVGNVLNAPPVDEWLRRAANVPDNEEGQIRNVDVLAQTMAAVIQQQDKKAGESLKATNGYVLEDQLADLFGSQGGMGRTLRDLWQAGMRSNPDLSPEEVGSMVWGWIEGQGWRFHEVDGRQRLVIDPNNYMGPEGTDTHQFVRNHLTRPFAPEYRQFLGQALGVEPTEIPQNLQDLFIRATGTEADPWVEGQFEVRIDPTSDAGMARLLTSKANLGGLEFTLTQVDRETGRNIDLFNVVSRREAVLPWTDANGDPIVIPKGTPLNVLNPDIFAKPDLRATPGTFSGPDLSYFAP